MLRIQIQEFDWLQWDYSMFGKFIYTYSPNPSAISFYLKDPIELKWGQGDADIFLDGKLIASPRVIASEADNSALVVSIVPDREKKYSTLEIKPLRGPIVIDNAEFIEQFITTHSLNAAYDQGQVLTGSFKIDIKNKK